MRIARWAVPAVAIAGLAILFLWLTRPEWAFCVDGVDAENNAYGYCDQGVLSLAAIIGTVAMGVLLIAYLVTIARVTGAHATTARAVGLAVLTAAAIGVTVTSQLGIEQAPLPY